MQPIAETKGHAPTARSRCQNAARVSRFYARAAYVTPKVALDAEHAAALHAYMMLKGVGVSDAIRAAIIAAAQPTHWAELPAAPGATATMLQTREGAAP